jgi:hypothetical protein
VSDSIVRVPIRMELRSPDGTPASGLGYISTPFLRDSAGHTVYAGQIVVTWNGTENFPVVDVPATNDPNVTPLNWALIFQFKTDAFVGVQLYQLDYTLTSGTLEDLTPVQTGVTYQSFIPLSEKGVAGGVPPLGVDGIVPTQFLPASAGGGVQSVTNTDGSISVITNTGIVTVSVESVAQANVVGLVAALLGKAPKTTLASTGLQVGTWGPGNATGQPTTLIPSSRWVTIAASIGQKLLWVPNWISTGADAQGDLCSVVNGVPVNFLSDNYGPAQAPNGHAGFYYSGDFGQANETPVPWIVQSTDIDSSGDVTLAAMYQSGSGSHEWGHASIPDTTSVFNFG